MGAYRAGPLLAHRNHAVRRRLLQLGETAACQKYETAVAKEQGLSPYDLINEQAAKRPAGVQRRACSCPICWGSGRHAGIRIPRPRGWGSRWKTTAADLFRAVLEGVTMNLNVILEAFRENHPHRRDLGHRRRRQGRRLVSDDGRRHKRPH